MCTVERVLFFFLKITPRLNTAYRDVFHWTKNKDWDNGFERAVLQQPPWSSNDAERPERRSAARTWRVASMIASAVLCIFMLFVNDDKTEKNNYDALWPWSGSYCFPARSPLLFIDNRWNKKKKVGLEKNVGVVNCVLLIYSGVCSDRCWSGALRSENWQ